MRTEFWKSITSSVSARPTLIPWRPKFTAAIPIQSPVGAFASSDGVQVEIEIACRSKIVTRSLPRLRADVNTGAHADYLGLPLR